MKPIPVFVGYDPREAIAKLPEYLQQKYGIKFFFNTELKY